MKRVFIYLLLGMALGAGAAEESKLPDASWQKLPKWRGFNLQGLFMKEDWCEGKFVETDFQYIADWGFNFVRLPMDYRFWIKDGDWRSFDEETLRKIDQAVEWGDKYDLHVMINFHRAPGYTIASPPEPRSLWTDEEVQDVCAFHWRTFARRYKGIPNRKLSFNLFNEPYGTDATNYAVVVKRMVEAIRAEDPDRLIVCDALNGDIASFAELLPLKVAFSARGYVPHAVTHYKAEWVAGSENFPVPVWPIPMPVNAYLCAYDDAYSGKKKGPLEIRCDLKKETELRLLVYEVSRRAKVVVRADGEQVFVKAFDAAPSSGSAANLYHGNIVREVCSVMLPAGTKNVQVENVAGDWVSISKLAMMPVKGATDDLAELGPMVLAWGRGQAAFALDKDGKFTPAEGPVNLYDKKVLWDNYVRPFKDYAEQGAGLMIGEWGAHNRTSHDVMMRWSEDCLQNWQKADLGWALWNLRGSFGVMDSERDDVEYEEFNGHKLDREFLDLLQKY